MNSTACKYYTERTLGWMLNNKIIVLLSLLSFSLFVSTLAIAGQRNRLSTQLKDLKNSIENPTTVLTTGPSDATTTPVAEETTTLAPITNVPEPTTVIPEATTVVTEDSTVVTTPAGSGGGNAAEAVNAAAATDSEQAPQESEAEARSRLLKIMGYVA